MNFFCKNMFAGCTKNVVLGQNFNKICAKSWSNVEHVANGNVGDHVEKGRDENEDHDGPEVVGAGVALLGGVLDVAAV